MNPEDSKVELATVFEQSRQNARQIETVFEAIGKLRDSIDALGNRINTATAPNFSTMAAWAGILLTIIGMVATPVAFYFYDTSRSLDMKLQKEYQLVMKRWWSGLQRKRSRW